MKRCYYQVLEVDRKAQLSEIKSSYRKLALKFHPDKNPGEQTKKLFMEVQQAYQVLSDPNERTWYDNNREKILFNKEDMSKQDIQMHTFGFNIWAYFTPSCFKGYQDNEGGFYQIYREVFEKIKSQQKKSYDNSNQELGDFRKLEGFGDSKTILEKTLKFYQDWQNFTTYKTFCWIQQWDTKQAPNRYVRRQMQKENKKQRMKEKKHYIKTIKDLIDYLKKRDPRYKQYLQKQRELQLKKQSEKLKQIEQAKKFKEQQKKVKKQLDDQRLKQIEQYYKDKAMQENLEDQKYQQEEQTSQFYCQVCQKQFKSQGQLNNHNNSKLHKDKMKLIFKQVGLSSEKIQQFDQEETQDSKKKKSKKQKKKNKNKAKNIEQQQQQEQIQNNGQTEKEQLKQEKASTQKIIPEKKIQTKQPQPKIQIKPQTKINSNITEQQKQPNKKKKKKRKDELVLSENSEEQTRPQVIEQKKKEEKKIQKHQEQSDDQDDFINSMLKAKQLKKKVIQEDEEQIIKQKTTPIQKKKQVQEEVPQQKQLNKAKLKKLNKAKKQQENKTKCLVCGNVFPSKTKMFQHINQTGHAQKK